MSTVLARTFIGDYQIQDIEGREYGLFYLQNQPFHCHQYLSLAEHESLLLSAQAEARREAFEEAAKHLSQLEREYCHFSSFPSRGDWKAVTHTFTAWAKQATIPATQDSAPLPKEERKP